MTEVIITKYVIDQNDFPTLYDVNYIKYMKKYEIVIEFFPKLSKGLKRHLQTTIL